MSLAIKKLPKFDPKFTHNFQSVTHNIARKFSTTRDHTNLFSTSRVTRKSIQLSVNPIIKRNIVILNELWNQRSANWSWAFSCARKHLRFHLADSVTPLSDSLHAHDGEYQSSKTHPRAEIKQKARSGYMAWISKRRSHHGSPDFWKSVSQMCSGESVWVWMSLLNGSKIFFSCVVNYNIASLSTAITAVYNERRASVRFGRQDGKTRNFSRQFFVRYRSWSKQSNSIKGITTLMFRGKSCLLVSF